MNVFGNKECRATDAIVEGIAPLIRFSAMHGGLPSGYWDDPYVLGFLQGCAFKISEKAGLKSGGAAHARAWLEAWKRLTGERAPAIVNRFRALNTARDPGLLLGMGNAALCASYAFGWEDWPDDPAVTRARRTGSTYSVVLGHANRENPERIKTAGALVHMLFHDVVQARLGPARQP